MNTITKCTNCQRRNACPLMKVSEKVRSVYAYLCDFTPVGKTEDVSMGTGKNPYIVPELLQPISFKRHC